MSRVAFVVVLGVMLQSSPTADAVGNYDAQDRRRVSDRQDDERPQKA